MDITTGMIKALRDKTGAGMMDCKKALEATGGNMDAAIEHLRKKGAAVAAKRADRSAKEGVIVTRVSPDGKIGVVVEINSETDFVGRSEDFVRFADVVAATIERTRPANTEDLLAAKTPDGKTVSELMDALLAKVGEKIDVRRFKIVASADGLVSSYTHLGSKIGVLVNMGGMPAGDVGKSIGRDVAMQVAAMSPSVVSRDQVDRQTIERELDIYRTQATNEGKPAQVIDRIAQGKLEKFFQEACLIEQTFIKDPGKTIKEYLHEAAPASVIHSFTRFHLGEELRGS